MSIEKTPKYRHAYSCGSRIAHFRQAQGWSQRELARQAGFSYQQISKVEAGDINTPIETLARLAAVLGVRLQALIDDEAQHLTGSTELVPLVFGIVADIQTAQSVLADAALLKLQRLGEVTGIMVPVTVTPEGLTPSTSSHSSPKSGSRLRAPLPFLAHRALPAFAYAH